MAAPITTPTRGPDQDQTAAPLNEPSMEDILASIRRIIAEDQSHGLARSGLTGLTRRNQPPEAATVAPAAPAAEIPSVEPAPIEAHEAKFVADAADPHPALQADLLHDSYEPDAHHSEAVSEEETFPPMHADAFGEGRDSVPGFEPILPRFEAPIEAAPPLDVEEAEPLMSSSTGASITSSFHALAESVVMQDPGLIERIMRETMRPLLKEWLDDHLPSIVERLVRAEIERVARGGRSH